MHNTNVFIYIPDNIVIITIYFWINRRLSFIHRLLWSLKILKWYIIISAIVIVIDKILWFAVFGSNGSINIITSLLSIIIVTIIIVINVIIIIIIIITTTIIVIIGANIINVVVIVVIIVIVIVIVIIIIIIVIMTTTIIFAVSLSLPWS